MEARYPMNRSMRAASRLGGRPEAEQRIAVEGQDAYELRVYRDCMRVATVFEEIDHLLNLMTRAQTFQEVRVLLKTYLISWATLWDAAANVVNQIMQLGLAAHRVSWRAVVGNKAVQATPIAVALAKFDTVLRRDHFINIRNHIVHRGWLADDEFDQLFGEWLFIAVMASVREPEDRVDGALLEAARESGMHSKIMNLIAAKQRQLAEHLESTFQALEQLDEILEVELRQRCAA